MSFGVQCSEEDIIFFTFRYLDLCSRVCPLLSTAGWGMISMPLLPLLLAFIRWRLQSNQFLNSYSLQNSLWHGRVAENVLPPSGIRKEQNSFFNGSCSQNSALLCVQHWLSLHWGHIFLFNKLTGSSSQSLPYHWLSCYNFWGLVWWEGEGKKDTLLVARRKAHKMRVLEVGKVPWRSSGPINMPAQAGSQRAHCPRPTSKHHQLSRQPAAVLRQPPIAKSFLMLRRKLLTVFQFVPTGAVPECH